MAWTTQNDSNGVSHNVWMQERGASCGPSCCMMVVRLILQRTLTSESSVLSLLDSTERHAWEQLGQVQGRSSWESDGVFATSISQVLAKLKVSSAYTVKTGSVASLCKRATLKRPAIMAIRWRGGGEHYTVCLGPQGMNNIVFLDPAYGVVETFATDLPKYPNGGTLILPSVTT